MFHEARESTISTYQVKELSHGRRTLSQAVLAYFGFIVSFFFSSVYKGLIHSS